MSNILWCPTYVAAPYHRFPIHVATNKVNIPPDATARTTQASVRTFGIYYQSSYPHVPRPFQTIQKFATQLSTPKIYQTFKSSHMCTSLVFFSFFSTGTVLYLEILWENYMPSTYIHVEVHFILSSSSDSTNGNRTVGQTCPSSPRRCWCCQWFPWPVNHKRCKK